MQFRTRKHGTPSQIGKKFPVVEKKKLPPKISLPNAHNRMSGISAITYVPPAEGKDGKISFLFDGTQISNTIVVVPKNERVGQFDLLKNAVYVDDDVAQKWIKYLSIHESIERYLKLKYDLNENAEGHVLANDIEKREFLKSHPLSEWRQYDKTVKFVSHLNSASGGKATREVDLHRAYELLDKKRRQLLWATKGIDSVVKKRSDDYEEEDFAKQLKRSIAKKLGGA